MNGQLDLSFSHQGGSEVGELPAVVDVVNVNLEAVVKPRLVRLARGWRQNLKPGTYLIRVRFPSGQEIRRTCTVRDGDQIALSVDVHGLSGHGSLERPAALRRLVREGVTRSLVGPRIALAWAQRWRGQASRQWQSIDFDGMAVSGDDYMVRYRFASPLQSNVLQLGGPIVASRFITLPASPVVDVTVSPRGKNDLAVEVMTDSAKAEALLGYLRTGAVEGADVTAASLLKQKRRDPIAAAIGGYYLLRTAGLDRLSDWGPNLSRSFPWLPDGAVINSWQHIHAGRERRGDPERHFVAARRQLILAARRGVPVYTEGLRLLIDGLRLLREDAKAGDDELDAAVAFIEPFAAAADWSAATVTYSGTDPGVPRPGRWHGTPEDRERLVMLRPDQPDPDHVLTWRQRKILQVIRQSVQHRGYPPSRREIGEAVGLTSTSSVLYQLSTLQSKGYLRWEAGRPRTLEVRLPGHPPVRPEAEEPEEAAALDIASQDAAYVPLIGRIAAGGPILAEEAIEDIFPLPKQLVGNGTLFLLKVVGNSMINAAIADGDLVVVRQQPTARDGDIVAAMIDGEATVKTFRPFEGHIWLMPHNPAYMPIPGDDATILGRVVAIIRRV
jgi:repressor LexA